MSWGGSARLGARLHDVGHGAGVHGGRGAVPGAHKHGVGGVGHVETHVAADALGVARVAPLVKEHALVAARGAVEMSH